MKPTENVTLRFRMVSPSGRFLGWIIRPTRDSAEATLRKVFARGEVHLEGPVEDPELNPD